MSRALGCGAAMGLGVLLSAACTLNNPDPMRAQPKAHAYGPSTFFPDGAAMRLPPDGVVAREDGLAGDAIPGGGRDGGYADRIPIPLTVALLQQGHDRFDVYCSPCHGLLADGNGPVAAKMIVRPPPALVGPGAIRTHAPAPPGSDLAHPVGFYVTVISEGAGLMPSYSWALSPTERWAVVAYLRALQRSQSAPVDDAPPLVRRQLEGER